MKNKNVIRFVESFILLPVLTMSSAGSLPKDSMVMTQNTLSSTKIVSSIKQNIEASNLFAFNTATDEKALEEEKIQQKLAVRQAKADAIDAFFAKRDAPLEGYGMKMVQEAEEHGLDWRLLPSIATVESNGGLQTCRKVTFSNFGWGSCKINFKSVKHGIEVVALNLGGDNPRTVRYYQKGMNLDKLLKTYNPPSIVPDYSSKVIRVMKIIGPAEIILDTDTKTEA